MKVKIKRIEKHQESKFYLTIYFDCPRTGEELRIKMTKAHLLNLIDRAKLPRKLTKGLLINVCERKGRTQPLYYVYGHEENEQ